MAPSGETNPWITGREDTVSLTDLVGVGGKRGEGVGKLGLRRV